jgi:hypothetical protein
MTEQQHPKDPPIYKHLSPKTQGFLRASANQRNERARLNDDTMSTEQTYVDSWKMVSSELFGGEANFCAHSFIAIKPDGVQVFLMRYRSGLRIVTDLF